MGIELGTSGLPTDTKDTCTHTQGAQKKQLLGQQEADENTKGL